MTTPEDVLSFWFGDLDAHGLSSEAQAARWWRKDPAFDETIRARFLDGYEMVRTDGAEDWLRTGAGRLAAIVVLDQFGRNMFRDTPAMYAADPKALALCHEGLRLGVDRSLIGHQRAFFYLPLMHSEALADQDRCVACFEAFRRELPAEVAERLAGHERAAEQHRAIVARFGRFPHRNEILGRASTDEEIAFLKEPGSRF